MAKSYKATVTVQADVPLVPTWVTRKGNVRRISTLKARTLKGILANARRSGIDFDRFRVFREIEAELAKRPARS